jgi:ubiquinone/menaquinone biosynthesis C-methylase UbiE
MATRFDRWASTYDDSALQPVLFVPVHQTVLHLAQQLLPRPGSLLDVGCGTGRLLRHARQRYPAVELVGVDLAGRMLEAAVAATPAELAIRYVHARAERLPFGDGRFDLVLATMSVRHWTDRAAGIAEIGRVLTPGGVVVVADVFPATRRRRAVTVPALRRRRRPSVPAELDRVLAAQRLAVVGRGHTRWLRLPDVQVIAAQRRPAAVPALG